MVQIQNILRHSNKYHSNRINAVITLINYCFLWLQGHKRDLPLKRYVFFALPAQFLFHYPDSESSTFYCNTNRLICETWEMLTWFSGWQTCSIRLGAQGCLPAPISLQVTSLSVYDCSVLYLLYFSFLPPNCLKANLDVHMYVFSCVMFVYNCLYV